VVRRAGQILGNLSDAEDVLQDVFRTVMTKIDSFRGDSAVGTWLYQITTRACLDRLKITKRRRELLASRAADSSDARPVPTDTSALLRDVLARLPRQLATVAVYYYVDDMTHEEIASVLGCSRRKVGYLLESFHTRAARLVDLPATQEGDI